MLNILGEFLSDPTLPDQFRLRPSAFTRQRTLTLPTLAAMMIGGLCASIQSELDALFARFKGSIGRLRCVSAQAFSKARQGFSATLFRDANDRLLEAAQDLFARHAWNGLRPIAADGSRLIVSTRAGRALKAEHFAFALYAPGAELTLHASLHPADGCERQMLFEALDLLQPGRDLLVLDRGYPAVWLAALLVQRGIDFCMRIDGANWRVVKRFLRSGKNEAVVTLGQPPADKCQIYGVQRRPTQARLIRQITPNGKVHVLLTSLLTASPIWERLLPRSVCSDSRKCAAGLISARRSRGRWRRSLTGGCSPAGILDCCGIYRHASRRYGQGEQKTQLQGADKWQTWRGADAPVRQMHGQ